jgi:hypothetical protein
LSAGWHAPRLGVGMSCYGCRLTQSRKMVPGTRRTISLLGLRNGRQVAVPPLLGRRCRRVGGNACAETLIHCRWTTRSLPFAVSRGRLFGIEPFLDLGTAHELPFTGDRLDFNCARVACALELFCGDSGKVGKSEERLVCVETVWH